MNNQTIRRMQERMGREASEEDAKIFTTFLADWFGCIEEDVPVYAESLEPEKWLKLMEAALATEFPNNLSSRILRQGNGCCPVKDLAFCILYSAGCTASSSDVCEYPIHWLDGEDETVCALDHRVE